MVTANLSLLTISHTGTTMINWTDPKNLTDMDDATATNLHKWLRGILPMGSMTVTFTKADGTARVMNCTLDPALLPVVEPKPIVEGKAPRKESTTSMRVYDLDKKEWRSFTIKNVKQIELTIGEHTGD